MGCDVPAGHVLYAFEHAVVLANTSQSNSRTSIELAVFDKDVKRVSLWRNRIITIVHRPATEGNVISVNGIGAIGIDSVGLDDVSETQPCQSSMNLPQLWMYC